MKKFTKDAVGISYDRNTFELVVKDIVVNDKTSRKKNYKKLRGKYQTSCGNKYAVLFYKFTKDKLVVTDFFRCVLVDPDYYVKQQKKFGINAMAIDEMTLREKWLSTANKNSDFGVYSRAVEFLSTIWAEIYGALGFVDQQTKHYFDKHVAK